MNRNSLQMAVLAFAAGVASCVQASEGIRQMMVRVEQISPTPIVTDAPTISAPGYYALGQDILGPVTIETNGVTLDLNGYTVTGNTAGIVNTGSLRDIVVRNGFVYNSDYGVCFDSCQDVLVEDVVVDTATVGICLTSCTSCAIRNCTVSNATSVGVGNSGGSGNTISGCTCRNLSNDATDVVVSGIQLLSEGADLIRDCVIDSVSASDGSAYGINLGDLAITETQELLVTGTTADGSHYDDVSWSPTGTYLVGVGFKENNLAMYMSAFSGNQLAAPTIYTSIASTINAHPQIQWAPDGSAIAACGIGAGPAGKLAVYPVSGGVPGTATVLTIDTSVVSISWSPDSAYLTAVSYDGTDSYTRVYSYTAGTPPTVVQVASSTLTGYQGRSISFSYDGLYIAVGANKTSDNTGHLVTYEWQSSGALLTQLQDIELERDVTTVAWSPVENRLASASMNDLDTVYLRIFLLRQNCLYQETIALNSMYHGDDYVYNARLIAWAHDGKYLSLVHRYLRPTATDANHYYTTVYSLAGNLLLTEDFEEAVEFQWTTAWHPNDNYFVTAGRQTTLSAFVDLYLVERGSATGGIGCIVSGNRISRVTGNTLGIGLGGVATENAITGNVSYNNMQNYSVGIDNVAVGYGAVPGLLDNISLPG